MRCSVFGGYSKLLDSHSHGADTAIQVMLCDAGIHQPSGNPLNINRNHD